MELFLLNSSKWYLLVADYYITFPQVQILFTISTNDVISTLEFLFFSTWYSTGSHLCQLDIIQQQGIQMSLVPSGGFTLTASSPHKLKDNGFVKKKVQTINRLFSRFGEDGSSCQIAPFELRETPLRMRCHQ